MDYGVHMLIRLLLDNVTRRTDQGGAAIRVRSRGTTHASDTALHLTSVSDSLTPALRRTLRRVSQSFSTRAYDFNRRHGRCRISLRVSVVRDIAASTVRIPAHRNSARPSPRGKYISGRWDSGLRSPDYWCNTIRSRGAR